MATGNAEDFANYPSMAHSNTEVLQKMGALELGKVYSGDSRVTAFMTMEEFEKKWNPNTPKVEESVVDVVDDEC